MHRKWSKVTIGGIFILVLMSFCSAVIASQTIEEQVTDQARALNWEKVDHLLAEEINHAKGEKLRRLKDLRGYFAQEMIRLKWTVAVKEESGQPDVAETILLNKLEQVAGNNEIKQDVLAMLTAFYLRQGRLSEAEKTLQDVDHHVDNYSEERERALHGMIALAASEQGYRALRDRQLSDIFRMAHGYPKLWRFSINGGLQHLPSGLILPVAAGTWLMTEPKLSNALGRESEIEYRSRAEKNARLTARLVMAPTSESELESAQTKLDRLVAIFAGIETTKADISAAEVPVQLSSPLVSAQRVLRTTKGNEHNGNAEPEAVIGVLIKKGKKQLQVLALVPQKSIDSAISDVNAWLAGIVWYDDAGIAACPLAGEEAELIRQLQEASVRGTYKATTTSSARILLKDGCYPLGIGLAHYLQGQQAYKRKNWSVSLSEFEDTLAAWKYASTETETDQARRTLLLTLDSAVRGKNKAAIQRNRNMAYGKKLYDMRFRGWRTLDDASGYLQTDTDRILPWRINTFSLELIEFYRGQAAYIDLLSGARLGITFLQSGNPFAGNVPDAMRVWMRNKSVQVTDDAGVMSTVLLPDGTQGSMWSFTYRRPQQNGTAGEGHMLFWVLPVKNYTVVLRGDVVPGHADYEPALKALAKELIKQF